MEDAYRALLRGTDWLYVVVYRNGVFFWDLWSFIHLWSGIVLMAAMMRARVRRPVVWLVVLLTGYEFLELVLLVMSIRVFQPEVLLDKLYDVIVGCAGGAVAWWGVPALQRASVRRNGDLVVTATAGGFAAVSIAFDWVGFYGYTYNVAELNSPGINWWAFTFWAVGLTVFLLTNTLLRRRVPNPAMRLPIIMVGYALGLLALEFAGDAVLGIHESRSALYPPLLFGLIHGSGVLRVFYGVAGFAAILGQDLMERLFGLDARGETIWVPSSVSALTTS